MRRCPPCWPVAPPSLPRACSRSMCPCLWRAKRRSRRARRCPRKRCPPT
nr:MAG TPA: hypothetical protein [Caudoviricetes sp.]